MKGSKLFGPIFGSIIKLVGTSAIANLVPIISIPLMLVYFSPAEFGEGAVFFSILTIGAQVLNLKYDHAILVADSDDEANKLLTVSLINTFILSFLFLLIAFSLQYLFGFYQFSPILYLLSFFGIGLNSVLNLAYLLSNYKLNIRNMNISSLLPIVLYPLVSIVGGMLNMFSSHPLVYARFISLTIGLIIILLFVRIRLNFHGFRTIMVKFKSYPFAILPGKLINTASNRGIDLIIPTLHGLEGMGYFTLARSLLRLPENILSRPIDSFLRRSSYENNKLNVNKLILKYKLTTYALLPLGLLFVIICINLDYVLSLFGVETIEWREAIQLIRILAYSYAVSFIVISFMSAFRLFGKERNELSFQNAYLASIIIFYFLTKIFHLDLYESFFAFGILRTLAFIFSAILIVLIVKKFNKVHE